MPPEYFNVSQAYNFASNVGGKEGRVKCKSRGGTYRTGAELLKLNQKEPKSGKCSGTATQSYYRTSFPTALGVGVITTPEEGRI